MKIILQYQQLGLLKQESPFATIGSLIGPLMANMMFRRANVGLPIPDIDPKAHVEGFLNGRRL